MAIMSDADRAAGWAEYMQSIPPGVTHSSLKADLRAAWNAADTWMDSNGASYNAALPQPFRGAASTAEKARLLVMVLSKRYNLGL